ncbi:MAG TPA: hypothetical protein VF950_18665, partial [Planctomycetota bacterium]
MDTRRKEIDVLEGDVKRLEQQIAAECVEIGRRLAGLDRARLRHEELLKYLNSVDTLRRSVDGFRSDIEKIREFDRRIETRAREVDDNRRRRDQLLREREGKFVELGAGGFGVYKRLSDREPWRGLFDDVLKIDAEEERRREELRAIEEDEKGKGFFEKLKLKTRKVILRGDLNRLDREKASSYAKAGAKIAESDFGRLTDGPLLQLFEAVEEKRRLAAELSVEGDRKIEEIEAARGELKRLEAEGRAEDRIREIANRIDALVKDLDVMHCWAGQLYLERDLRGEIGDEPLAAKTGIVSGLRDTISKKRKQIDRLKAEIEIEEIERAEKEKRGRRRQLEEERRVKERQIAVLDIEINAGLKRAEELRRVLAGETPFVEAPP